MSNSKTIHVIVPRFAACALAVCLASSCSDDSKKSSVTGTSAGTDNGGSTSTQTDGSGSTLTGPGAGTALTDSGLGSGGSATGSGGGASDTATSGSGSGADGTTCAYSGEAPHPCECADGADNDSDSHPDQADLHCFGPFDDNEAEYATGIPGDNNGSKASKECPFDGNSGTGNDGVCCNPANPAENVTPNGCDNRGCCEIDLNGNGSGEYVFISSKCDFTPVCGADGKLGCPCSAVEDCDSGQYCTEDGALEKLCSNCETCEPNAECLNRCDCGETCFGGFARPAAQCGTAVSGGGGTVTDQDTVTGGGDTGGTATDGGSDTSTVTGGSGTASCEDGLTPCPAGDGDCDSAAFEVCVTGCCYPTCPKGVVGCKVSSDCPGDATQYCVTGCCILAPI